MEPRVWHFVLYNCGKSRFYEHPISANSTFPRRARAPMELDFVALNISVNDNVNENINEHGNVNEPKT
jgi:hypothetical protein